ncbi:heat shock 70 kDa protein [Tribolium castaneum]|uniref:Major heat shock 70 kDa protein Ab-like Protein n=1 Tax=Tribolium castaneum TaxID=7070 RepID=D6WR16_TRICA|nr:PREDICTED: heat shock 70 kDa protein [Tribolium castaneum]EFA06541.1 Major heat shock 70 kDa protein Ab-like Protein [Tribolium castaneum]|eukprot:XP_008195124.1 PREDICTED: heat shock 70 kDa protein [Tribolium castaneum]
MQAKTDLVIGIDLGTTNSSAAYYFKEKVRVVENKEGDRITPSCVYFRDQNTVIVGKYARKMAEQSNQSEVFGIKRFIGKQFDDPDLRNDLRHVPFTIESIENKPIVTINHKSGVCKKTPEEVSALVLQKVKTDVESKLGERVNKAVITVPAYFNVSQREATLEAAQKAGFTVLKLLNEPTAAAFCYYVDQNWGEESYSLVYDLGGGTFDVAILKNCRQNIDIVGVDGDTHLGGHDFDNLIIDYVCDILLKEYDYNPKDDRRNMRRLRSICEEAKQTLSDLEETIIILPAFTKKHDIININITREQFESMAQMLFQRTIDIVDKCLTTCNIAKTEIKEVILSGGSTRIPEIQNLLSSYFGGKELCKFTHPGECVAEGAAIQAAILSTNPDQKINTIQIKDVISLSLGIDVHFNLMFFIIKRNRSIPIKKTKSLITIFNQQSAMSINIYEGERTDVRKNRHLGTLKITNLTPAPPGQCEVHVIMSVDQNGILTFRAKEKFRNNEKDLKLLYTRGGRSDSEVKSILQKVEDQAEEDERFEKFAMKKTVLFNYCETVIYNLESKNLSSSYKEVYDLCKDTQNKLESLELGSEDQVNPLVEAAKSKCDSLVRQYNFDYMFDL